MKLSSKLERIKQNAIELREKNATDRNFYIEETIDYVIDEVMKLCEKKYNEGDKA